MKIVIAEKYAGGYVFGTFADRRADTCDRLLQDDDFRNQVSHLQHALEKSTGEYYVINMTKAGQHDPDGDRHDLAAHNIMVRFYHPLVVAISRESTAPGPSPISCCVCKSILLEEGVAGGLAPLHAWCVHLGRR